MLQLRACKQLCYAIQAWPRLGSYTSEILCSTRRHLQPRFCYKGRNANNCADQIAKFAPSLNVYEAVLECSVPNWLHPIVEREYLDGEL